MVAVAVVKGRDGSEVVINELAQSFAKWTSEVQYIARCTCSWQEQHIVLRPLLTTAAQHAAQHTKPTTPA